METPKMVTPDKLDRRTALKGVSLGAGTVVLQAFVNGLAWNAVNVAIVWYLIVRLRREPGGRVIGSPP